MNAWVGWELVALVILLVCSALLTGAEAAYFSLGRARLRRLARAGKTPETLVPLLSQPHALLVTLLVGITLLNIGASALATVVGDELFGRRGGEQFLHPGLTFVQPVTGFQVASVHSIVECSAIPARRFLRS